MSETFRTSIEIAADPDRVFDHFVQPELLVRWMGDRARLEARRDGVFALDINGVIIRGHFVRVERPHLIEIAWGEAGNDAMPPGSTRLIVRLTAQAGGTLVELEHHGLTADETTKHARGWPHFLGRLGVLAQGDDPGVDPWTTAPPNP
ncbi:MAG TPA: SRPBCC domain-containing protein [Polyangiaceae bacterium]|nr:SRPBCC domain-containing protein [Polyangiaceae bacterium]